MNIPDERIKTISASFEGCEGADEYLKERVLYEIAHGIIIKLKEFSKVKIIRDGPYIRAECSLQIIVPSGVMSNRPISSIPSPE